jgi:hypothetical protein
MEAVTVIRSTQRGQHTACRQEAIKGDFRQLSPFIRDRPCDLVGSLTRGHILLRDFIFRQALPGNHQVEWSDIIRYFNRFLLLLLLLLFLLHGLSPRANYTDRATAACRRSDCRLLRIEGATWSAWRIPTAVFSIFLTGAATFLSSSSSVVLTRLSEPCYRPTTFFLVVPGIEPGPPNL